MALYRLPTEITSLILETLDSPQDLFSLISASARCFRVYNGSPQRALAAVLRNAILPNALPHAVAAVRAMAAVAPGLRQNESLEAFLDEYFETESFGFPADKESLIALCRLYSQTIYLIDGYSTRAMRTLGLERYVEPSLSPTERARFQRAFFRHELYSRVFSVDHARTSHSRVPADEQFYLFLGRVDPWEVEEMSCVHHYFASLVGECIDHLEHQVVQSVLNAPSVCRPPGSARPRPSTSEPTPRRRIPVTTASGWVDDSIIDSPKPTWIENGKGQTKAHDDAMTFFHHLDLTDLNMFSKDGRFHSSSIISYLGSLGLAFIYRLATADENERKDIVLKHAPPVGRDFLPEALACAVGVRPRTFISSEVDDRDISRPNLGWWFAFEDPEQVLYFQNNDVWFQISDDGIINSPLRERAFVFWDADRLTGPAWDNLLRAKNMAPAEVDRLFDRSARKSAEEQLLGVRLPQTLMDRIEREFGSTFEHPRATSSSRRLTSPFSSPRSSPELPNSTEGYTPPGQFDRRDEREGLVAE